MRFHKQEYWSGLPFPFPGDLPNPGVEPGSPALQAGSLASAGQICPLCSLPHSPSVCWDTDMTFIYMSCKVVFTLQKQIWPIVTPYGLQSLKHLLLFWPFAERYCKPILGKRCKEHRLWKYITNTEGKGECRPTKIITTTRQLFHKWWVCNRQEACRGSVVFCYLVRRLIDTGPEMMHY